VHAAIDLQKPARLTQHLFYFIAHETTTGGGRLNARGVAKYSDVGYIERYISGNAARCGLRQN